MHCQRRRRESHDSRGGVTERQGRSGARRGHVHVRNIADKKRPVHIVHGPFLFGSVFEHCQGDLRARFFFNRRFQLSHQLFVRRGQLNDLVVLLNGDVILRHRLLHLYLSLLLQ